MSLTEAARYQHQGLTLVDRQGRPFLQSPAQAARRRSPEARKCRQILPGALLVVLPCPRPYRQPLVPPWGAAHVLVNEEGTRNVPMIRSSAPNARAETYPFPEFNFNVLTHRQFCSFGAHNREGLGNRWPDTSGDRRIRPSGTQAAKSNEGVLRQPTAPCRPSRMATEHRPCTIPTSGAITRPIVSRRVLSASNLGPQLPFDSTSQMPHQAGSSASPPCPSVSMVVDDELGLIHLAPESRPGRWPVDRRCPPPKLPRRARVGHRHGKRTIIVHEQEMPSLGCRRAELQLSRRPRSSSLSSPRDGPRATTGGRPPLEQRTRPR